MSKRQADRLNRLRSPLSKKLRREKRGVVLLVVVSILVLFLMIGVTYVLVAGNYYQASGQALRAKTHGDEPEHEIEEVMGQLLFGTPQFGGTGPRSVISPHSLFADLYGNDRVVGTVMNVANNPSSLNSGQTVRIIVNLPPPIQPIPNYFAGRVITFTNGPAAGISTRVMGYIPPSLSGSGSPELLVEAPESDLPIPVGPSVDSRFVINGAPFNGTGAGLLASTQNLDETVSINAINYSAALLPNYIFHTSGNFAAGGLDEPYDAPDVQNMFMSMIPPRKISQFDGYPLLPSFHRPDLVRYWRTTQQVNQLLSGAANAQQAFFYPYGPDFIRGNADDLLGQPQADDLVALKRMMILRPLREDNPGFTGGNQNFAEDNLQGPYDVDNDGDGITDSIWIDAGLPVVTVPNGRRYKRLVAILIKDLDGRVNPSVHGNLVVANTPNARTAAQVTDTFAGMDPNSPTPIYLPRGVGFGPAEVDFRHIFNNVLPYSSTNDNANVYLNLLQQRYATPVYSQFLPGVTNTAAPPNTSPNDPTYDELFSFVKTFSIPYNHTVQPLSAYSTPPDVWGRAALAVDYTGQPMWFLAGMGERVEDPYEVQWDQMRANAESPYTVSELEALLRYHDLGASVIPSRLLLPGVNGAGQFLAVESRGTPGPSQFRRESFGMGSYIPTPKMLMPRELRAAYGGGSSSTILDLYFARLNQNTAQFQTVVPFEFLKGQMFNINREFGNGQQDPTPGVDPTLINTPPYGVVDDPSEPTLPELLPGTVLQFNHLNDSTAYDQRQLYARHLYCLMMLLRNQNKNYDTDGNGTPTQAETARLLAQWAINVVDFRDPDSIMTRFEYDENPYDANGWSINIDGDPNTPVPQTEGGVVWGCERPELLITETTNGHDRATEDLPDDGPNSNNRQVMDPERDATNDFDQRIKPRGWSFIELYNPWFDRSNNVYDHKPAEIYGNGGVDISRVNSSGTPVWRMLIVSGSNRNVDPDNPQPEAITLGVNGNPPPANANVERSIYFADLSAGGVNRPGGGSDGEAYFPSGGIPRNPVLPGRYAVIGSAGIADGTGNYITYLGRRSTEAGPPALPSVNPRQIILNPSAQTVRVTNNVTDGADDVNSASLQSVVALPLDMAIRGGTAVPQSLTISEPVGNYPPQVGWVAPTATEEGYYSPAIDGPFDIARTDGGQVFARDNTHINYRALHLQRLANPLLAWHRDSNPYMTVDTSSMDVMSYNGVTDDAMDPQLGAVGVQNFQSFQRGGRFYDSDAPEMVGGYTTPPTGRVFRDLWAQESPFLAPAANSPTEASAEPHYQPRPLYHTLGGLNRRYYPYFGAGAPPMYRGAPYFQDSNNVNAAPFPYFAFNNRPFNNVMELLQVPCWHSSKLLDKYGTQYLDSTNPSPPWQSMYQPLVPANPNAPYGHLLNFFHTTATPNNPNSTDAAEISRLFDFVETRTPYLQTEKYYNPTSFVVGNPAPAGYRPPFNYLSRFREPGRININTIFDENVWNASVRGFPGMCSFPQNTNEGDGGLFLWHLALSRQGYGAAFGDVLQHDPNFPSLFSQPFRTADSADLTPLNPNSVPPQLEPRRSPADGGLLRRDVIPYPNVNDNDRPLFASDNTLPYQDASRNPYFRYQGLQKIGNLFSTNSNCYAVWVTIGYFEVEANDADNNPNTPGQIDVAHPDGLRLAQEVGVDEGNVKRHRAFYIIDRSIPVGYEPGHRHNTDKAILLKRFIE